MPRQAELQSSGCTENPYRMIAGSRCDAGCIGRNTGHLDIIVVTAQHCSEAHVGRPPDPCGVVAARADQESPVGAEPALVGEVIVTSPRQAFFRPRVPEDDLIVITRSGDIAVAERIDTADWGSVRNHFCAAPPMLLTGPSARIFSSCTRNW